MESQKPEVQLGQGEIEAVVGKLRGYGNDRFVVAYPRDSEITNGKDITFSTKNWRGDSDPCHGEVVILGDVRLFAKGWRALYARPVSLQVISQKRGEV